MDLRPTIPMLTLPNSPIKVLHLEPTDACNAACPMCFREIDANFDKTNLSHLTVEQVASLVDETTIKGLDKMFMCGVYGEPAAGKHTVEIYRYFRSINPTIILGMNTNGGLRNTDWWREIANIFNQPRDYVVFSIDGLADTNHLYRINVDYDKVIDNARAFIGEGGSAHWDMIVFEHNEHQLADVEETAQKLGFSWFRAKASRRHATTPINFLHPPKSLKDPVVTEGTIDCHAVNESSIYISAKGIIHPCCWLANSKFTLNDFESISKSWKTDDPNTICKLSCTKNDQGTSFTNQWQREVELR